MNQKLSVYIKKGMRASRGAFRHQSQLYFKYCLFLLTSILGKLLFFTYPLYALAEVRIVKTINETGSFEVEKSFEDANSIKKVWTTILYYLVKGLIYLSGIIILSGFTYLLIYLGKTIDEMTTLKKYYVMFAFGIIGGILILLFIIMVHLLFAPATYLIQKYDDIGISDVISKSISIMSRKGKMKLFLIEIMHLLYFLLFASIFLGILWFFESIFLPLVVIFCSIIFAIILLIMIPKIILSNKIASICLIEELVNEEAYEDSLNNHDRQKSNIKVKKEDLLISLFDNSNIDSNKEPVNSENEER